MTEFERFWDVYPRHEAKLAAMKAFTKARRLATVEAIVTGVERYVRVMPADPQFRPLPATWLNAGRWMDEYDTSAKPRNQIAEQYRGGRSDWYEECRVLHNGACELDRHRHELRKQREEVKAS